MEHLMWKSHPPDFSHFPFENPQPTPPSDEILLRFWKKSFYGDVQQYTDIWFQSASKMQLFGVKKWCSPNVFSNTKQKHVCWKICKVLSDTVL